MGSSDANLTPTIRIETEEDAARGWRYEVVVEDARGDSRHTVTLSWVDHNYWSGGRCPPSTVVEAVVRALLDAPLTGGLPARFDASTARRWHPGLDDAVHSLL